MSYFIKYDQEYKRTMTGVIYDSRAVIPDAAGLGGFELKAYADSQLALVTDEVLSYKIITETGNIACVFTVLTSRGGRFGVRLQQFIRVAFQPFINEIEQTINDFIQNSVWKADFV